MLPSHAQVKLVRNIEDKHGLYSCIGFGFLNLSSNFRMLSQETLPGGKAILPSASFPVQRLPR